MREFDLVVRGGNVVDGTGAPPRSADVAVKEGLVVEVGRVGGRGTREVNADGAMVAPGFVDIHTHYDGQATWDDHLAPSSWHGVTTAVMGNCGVGFAPVRPSDHDRLIELMEGVEDIPGTALHEGLPWKWESFAEYLDFLETVPRDIDVGAQLPHAPLRVYVMGARAGAEHAATPDDIAAMARVARGAIEAGALGFTTSRTLNHRSISGEFTPTLKAEVDELVGIAQALGAAGQGVLQVVSDFVVDGIVDTEEEYALLYEMAAKSGRPLSISLAQGPSSPEKWRGLLDRFAAASAAGVQIRAQVAARAIGLLLGFDATLNPFMRAPAYRRLAMLPLKERVAQLRRPEVRRRILEERDTGAASAVLGAGLVDRFEAMYALGDPPDYEPDPSSSVAARAAREGRSAADVAYDLLLEAGGTALLYLPAGNWAYENLDTVREQLLHPAAVPGLSDAGAHAGTICDVSFPSTLLQWWGRDRPTGRIPVEVLVAKQSRLTAETVGLYDRGVLAPGYLADLNVIDFDGLTVRAPTIVRDLPAGGKRLVQRVEGYRHSFKAGIEIMRDGIATGALPGRLVRGAQPRPV